MNTGRVIKGRGYGPAMPFNDEQSPSQGQEPQREPNGEEQGGVYVLTLPRGSYEGTDDKEWLHIHRLHDDGGREHVCSLPSGDYHSSTDEAGTHIFKRGDAEAGEGAREAERGERDQSGVQHVHMPGAALARPHMGRDEGLTEYQKLQAYKKRLNEHYDKYRHWIRERTS
jgi:hypothetical protein